VTNIEQIQQLIEEIGPELNVQGVLQIAEDHWALVYDEQTIVEITHAAERKCLTLRVELGDADPENQLDTYRSMLAYSARSEETGGIRIALDSPYGSLVQILDLFTEELEGFTLITVLANFVETARTWQALLAAGGISPETAVAIPDEAGTPAGIRV